MKTQLEFLQEIVALKEAHPEMPIQFFVSENLCDGYAYTAHQITSVEVSPWYVVDGGSTYLSDEEDIKDRIADDLDNKYPDMGDAEFEQLEAQRYAEDVKRVILVYTDAGIADDGTDDKGAR